MQKNIAFDRMNCYIIKDMHNNPVQKKAAVFIETYGCQMNKYDSELISGLLVEKGFVIADTCEKADIVMVNTCSVREHAEERALGRIGALFEWKRRARGRKLGVIGCMGQRMGSDLFKKKPEVDFVVGPDSYRDLPEILKNGLEGPHVCTRMNPDERYESILPERDSKAFGWIAVSRGCDNFCSYCIVPYTRGRERSRSVKDILAELERMADRDFKEVTFLGQNVNSYRDGETDFADLLKLASKVRGILRIRFMTSHPKDLSGKLLDVMAAGGRICPHIHLPLQSGSNRILQAMNRGYTREHFMALVGKARNKIPGVSVTSDIMAGFPGESDSDFEETCRLLEAVRFDEAFTYAYSPRAGTRAAEIRETISRDEKGRRLEELIRIQRRISLEIKKGMIGSEVEILPEGPSVKSVSEWMGKTPSNLAVVFPGENCRPGVPVRIRIEQCRGATMWGNALTHTTSKRAALSDIALDGGK